MDQTTAKAPSPAEVREVPAGTDLIEWYYEQGYSDGFPLVPPTPAHRSPAARSGAVRTPAP